ncbi:MAG TPA: diacylglycerol kinase family protein [Ilumatobacteraceae bacterium]|nr:diacylglycerol kinase family protein [Ilumatobacteraceae bacterium]
MRPERTTGDPASRSEHPMLIVNPRSGGGKAARNDLIAQCGLRGIEPIVFEHGDDLSAVADKAIHDGAGVIGMAGGDGSQAAVAAVAAQRGVPFVCIPAGTRNHFALDIGVDVHDVAGALDAFLQADERRIDLARVNGRVFVNNVAMGVYAAVVQSPEYRDNKVRTTIRMLPGLVGPDATPFDLRFELPNGNAQRNAVLLIVSNNPYGTAPRPRRGTRGRLDAGVLGVIAVTRPPPRGVDEWTTKAFRVDSGATVALGIDGESVDMEPPLVFECLPQALTIRVPVRRSRVTPAGAKLRTVVMGHRVARD